MTRPTEPACHICGCTHNNPCEAGCEWVRMRPPLCSNPLCVIIDAFESELAWLHDQTGPKPVKRPIANRRRALRAGRKLVESVKQSLRRNGHG